MKKNNMIFWAMVFCTFSTIGSRAQTITHRDALVYYTGIALQVKEIVPKVRDVWGRVQLSLMAARESQTFRANPFDISSLKNAYAQNLRDLDRSIRTVNALEETDSEINLKKVVDVYLTDIKQAEEAALPKIISLLENGVNKINDQQTTMLKGFLYKGQELQTGLRTIENLLATYQRKYNITGEEMRMFGL
ncbi:MAG: hypothetical protein WKF88_08900 [Ferruginibacter sp.]